MKEAYIGDILAIVNEKLSKGGIFLSSGGMEKPNTMTIGWGGITRFWSLPVFVAPVRKSRYTHPLIMKSGCFTVSVPLTGMAEQLTFAGTASGRDTDKFTGHGLTAAKAQGMDEPIVKECELHLECRVLGRFETESPLLDAGTLEKWYPDRDLHTLFMGQIVACYYTD